MPQHQHQPISRFQHREHIVEAYSHLIREKMSEGRDGYFVNFMFNQFPGRRQLDQMRSRLLDRQYDFMLHPGDWEPALNDEAKKDLPELLESWLGAEKLPIRCRITLPPEDARPSSEDPKVTQAWSKPKEKEDYVNLSGPWRAQNPKWKHIKKGK